MNRQEISSMAALAALGEGWRRTLFDLIRRARRPVSREEAAASVGVSRRLAAFHLDKLVKAGLLRARYQTSPSAPRRAGRAPKVYEADDVDIQVSIPQREYAVLADILVETVRTETKGESAAQAALRMSLLRGKELGNAEPVPGGRAALDGPRCLDLAEGILRRHGFEPYRQGPGTVRLRNCPFHPLSAKAPGLVCGMNHAYLAGLLAGMGTESVQAFLDPRPGECCVELRTAHRSVPMEDL
jgi:predicted ArsR family transcriptional regulator